MKHGKPQKQAVAIALHTAGKDEHIGFKKLTEKLEHKGNSAESAKKIAAYIGRKKYGAKGMAKKAAAGRAKDSSRARFHRALDRALDCMYESSEVRPV